MSLLVVWRAGLNRAGLNFETYRVLVHHHFIREQEEDGKDARDVRPNPIPD